MIEVAVRLDGAGIVRVCEVRGHGGAGPRGSDVVCAAVTVLARSFAGVLSGREGITLRGEAPERGILRIETGYTPEGREFLAAAGAFLLEGLGSVAAEYPRHCTIRINEERRKEYGA
jgi:uncharacterized protein YsxB (DUF464 family)